jgi:hypothetical protein
MITDLTLKKERNDFIIEKIKELGDPVNKDYDKFTELVNGLTETMKTEFIEKSLRRLINLKLNYPIGEAITKMFHNYVILTLEPKEDIQNEEQNPKE